MASAGTALIVAGAAGPSTLPIGAAAEVFAASREISRQTLERLGVASGITWFPDLDRKSEALFFRYQEGWKARAFPEKAWVAGGGFKLAFWNIERVLAGNPKTVFLTEGECDALALVEAGASADSVLSVPNGARDRPADDPHEMRGYDYVKEALAAGLSRAERFIWCGDSDGPGIALRADMVRLLGAARFFFVNWPEGLKDANDVLMSDGPEFLYELVTEGVLPWPVAGVYRLSELPEPPPLTLWNPGFPEWEKKIMFAPRTLSVATGHPGHGKTQLMNQCIFNIVKTYGIAASIAGFETRAKPHLRRQLRTLFSGKLEINMSQQELNEADQWINDRYVFMVHPEQRPTLEWFLQMSEVAVIRHGVRFIQLDPWNRLESQMAQGEAKTDYIGRCLRTLYVFANDFNCHVQIIAHPAKMGSERRGQPPLLEDISDSKSWDAMVDQGFVVHRPKIYDDGERKTEADLYCRKARFEELGYPCHLQLRLDLSKGKFVSIDYENRS